MSKPKLTKMTRISTKTTKSWTRSRITSSLTPTPTMTWWTYHSEDKMTRAIVNSTEGG
jgi:hypothetical protein